MPSKESLNQMIDAKGFSIDTKPLNPKEAVVNCRPCAPRPMPQPCNCGPIRPPTPRPSPRPPVPCRG